MQIGHTRIIIRPALLMIFAGCVVGVGGIVAAGWYALGTQHNYGLAIPNRWTFGTQKPAQATINMLTATGTKTAIPNRNGYSSVNLDEGITVDVTQSGEATSNVYIRNSISVDKEMTKSDLQFQFDARAETPFPIIFTIRDAQMKSGGALLWSQTFTVQGDWETYRAPVPLRAVGQGKVQFMMLAGHLGTKNGSVSLRRVYLK